MTDLIIRQGDATKPDSTDSNKIIAHVCNDEGKWGKGFVLALGNAFPEAEKAYRSATDYKLGDVQFVQTSNPRIIVANMIAQRGVRTLKDGSQKGCPPIRYDALYEAMSKVASRLSGMQNAEVVCPKFGAGLAGGCWSLIEIMIRALWVQRGWTVSVYEPAAPVGTGTSIEDIFST